MLRRRSRSCSGSTEVSPIKFLPTPAHSLFPPRYVDPSLRSLFRFLRSPDRKPHSRNIGIYHFPWRLDLRAPGIRGRRRTAVEEDDQICFILSSILPKIGGEADRSFHSVGAVFSVIWRGQAIFTPGRSKCPLPMPYLLSFLSPRHGLVIALALASLPFFCLTLYLSARFLREREKREKERSC